MSEEKLRQRFEGKLNVSYSVLKDNIKKYKITIEWTEPVKLNANVMFAIYAHRREMDKNYIDYVYPKENCKEYTFSTDFWKGLYDIRVVEYEGHLICNYKRIYEIPHLFICEAEDNSFHLDCKPQYNPMNTSVPEVLVSFSNPAEEGDYIGMFEVGTLSVKDDKMIGIVHQEPKAGTLERYFKVNCTKDQVIGKEFNIKYFKKDCQITNSMDTSVIPFYISEPFKWDE